MPKLTRYLQKIFANNSNEVGVFGTGVDKETSKNVETLQSADYENGWSSAIITNKNYPIFQEMDGVQYGLSYQLKYLFQNGIPEWLSTETYYANTSFCQYGGKIYQSLQDDNTNHNPALNDGYWTPLLTSNRSIGEIVPSTLPLTEAGLHLLDGSLITSGMYADFVTYIADLYDTTTNIYSNVTKVGSLTDNNGVLSGFSTSNYAKLPTSFNPASNTWEIQLKFTTGNDVTTSKDYISANTNGQNNSCPFLFRILNSKFYLYASSTNNVSFDIANDVSGSYTVQTNTDYVVNISFTGTNYILKYSTDDGATFTQDISITSSSKIYTSDFTLIGAFVWNGGYENPIEGSLDLNGCYININGSRWWTGTLPVGFTDETSWQQSVTTYGVCGKFVYDDVNNTVRLPKITGFTESTITPVELGNLTEAGLPNHQHTYPTLNVPCQGGYDNYWGNANREGVSWSGWASDSNSIYGKSNTVQPQSIKILLYIVIATSTKTDIEVDIDEIATDLNGKADVDLTNVNNAGTSLGASWASASNNYIDLTLGASGATYTAPANGWFLIGKNASDQQYLYIGLASANGPAFTLCSSGNQELCASIYVSKGQSVLVGYNANGATNRFKFIYAKGSEWEA